MLMLVSGATASVPNYDVGTLIVPKAWAHADRLQLVPNRWAMDNGAFSGFDEGAFIRMLERFYGRPGCLFVTAPDVVADAAATLVKWPFWSELIWGLGYVPALVAQDGLMPADVPWDEIGALFIGGTTRYKESQDATSLAGYAKSRGLWVHVGRVNSKRRLAIAARMGADSYDGTGFSMMPDTNIPRGLRWTEEVLRQRREQAELPIEVHHG